VEIEITLVLTNIYENWPRIRQVPEELREGMFRARTGLIGWQDWSKKFLVVLIFL